MKRITLKELLNVTEQAPQPPEASPVPAAQKPEAGPTPDEPPIAPPTGNAPAPSDPNEYDWTTDFRTFEDTKNRAEAEAKKKLLDQMNEKMLGKKVTANASRGYGQPKTDYTIENVKKVSVEFWYKDWVVIVTDENDKKFFLTPGVNIKIEQGESPAPEAQPQATQAPEEPPKAEPSVEQPPAPPEGGEAPPAPQPAQEPQAQEVPNQQPPAQEPQPQPEPQPEQPPVPPKKKKKVPVAEDLIQNQVSNFLAEFFGLEEFDASPYIKKAELNLENSNVMCEVHIPKNTLRSFDSRDLMLEFKDKNRDGRVDVQSVGRFIIFNFSYSGR